MAEELVDFAKARRNRGRSFQTDVRQLLALLKAISAEQGVDLQARLELAKTKGEGQRRGLTEALMRSVVPLLTEDDRRRPSGLGSCVLVRIDSRPFALTAAHVIREVGTARLFAPSEAGGGRLVPLPSCTARVCSNLDVAVIALSRDNLGPFRLHTFLDATDLDQSQFDGTGLDGYLVLGYPASPTQMKLSPAELRLDIRLFSLRTSSVTPAEYEQEALPASDHLVLDFDHKEIEIDGARVTPPMLHGVSGGGIFRLPFGSDQARLVGVATENRRKQRLIVGTRIKHFLALAREIETGPRAQS